MKFQINTIYTLFVLLIASISVQAQIEVKNDGDVIVGNSQTTSPTYTRGLRVYGNIYAPTVQGNESSLVGFKNIIGRSGDGILHLQGGVSGGLILMNNSHNGNIAMANGGGNVLIGALSQNNGFINRLFVNGSVGATLGFWENLVQIKSKSSNAENNPEALSLINSLTGNVSGASKSSNTTNTGYGFYINDDLISKMPYAFRGNSKDGYQVNYNSLIPLLVEGIKELNNKANQVESLKAEIELLKEAIKQQGTNNDITSTKNVEIYQNTPNPYSNATQIKYFLNEKIKNAKLVIYDLQGSQKKSITIQKRGHGQIEVDRDLLPSGMYLYLISYDNQFSDTKKMILMN